MRKALILSALALALLLPSTGCVSTDAQEGDRHEHVFGKYNFPGAKRRVAVVRFQNKSPYGAELGDTAADVMTSELRRSAYFDVYDRSSMADSLRELRFEGDRVQWGGAKEPQKIPLDAIVVGTVTNYGVKVVGTDVIVYQKKEQQVECTVDIKVINHRTTQIVGGAHGQARFTTAASGAFGSTGQSYDQTLAQKALRVAIDDCIEKVIQQIGSIEVVGGPGPGLQPGGAQPAGPEKPKEYNPD